MHTASNEGMPQPVWKTVEKSKPRGRRNRYEDEARPPLPPWPRGQTATVVRPNPEGGGAPHVNPRTQGDNAERRIIIMAIVAQTFAGDLTGKPLRADS